MSTSFGDPTFGAAATGEAAAPAPELSSAPQELLDPNDPRFTSELLDVNTEADAYAQPAPPPDGNYKAKLKLVQKEVNGTKRDWVPALWGKSPSQAVAVAAVEASIIDPTGKHDGLKAFDFNVSTFIGRDNATKMATLLGKLHRPNGQPWVTKGQRLSASDWAKMLVEALAGEPECGIATAWEWSCADCGKEAKAAAKAYPKSLVGMSHFPAEQDPNKRKAGQMFSPEVKCPINPAHGYSRARITIARFLSLEELKKG